MLVLLSKGLYLWKATDYLITGTSRFILGAAAVNVCRLHDLKSQKILLLTTEHGIFTS